MKTKLRQLVVSRKELANNLAALRMSRGLDGVGASKATGVKPSNWSRYEKGTQEPRCLTLAQIALALDADPNTLLLRPDAPRPADLDDETEQSLIRVHYELARLHRSCVGTKNNPVSVLADFLGEITDSFAQLGAPSGERAESSPLPPEDLAALARLLGRLVDNEQNEDLGDLADALLTKLGRLYGSTKGRSSKPGRPRTPEINEDDESDEGGSDEPSPSDPSPKKPRPRP